MSRIRFWNGNKSKVRQSYELTLIQHVLATCDTEHAQATVIEDKTDYPRAEDEGAVFQKDIDLCVTVAGNRKFSQGSFIPIYTPLMSGLLGHRLLIIRESDAVVFSEIKTANQLKQKTVGIPATWADAQLFRDNQFKVSERGALEDLFPRLKQGECDYVALGANEAHSIFNDMAKDLGGLMLEKTLCLYYPFALVFYVSPSHPALAHSLETGLLALKENAQHQTLFNDFFGATLADARLHQRQQIQLENLALPRSMKQTMALANTDLMNTLRNK